MIKIIKTSLVFGAILILKSNHTAQAGIINHEGAHLYPTNFIEVRGGHREDEAYGARKSPNVEEGERQRGEAEMGSHENNLNKPQENLNRDRHYDWNNEGAGVPGYEGNCWTDANGIQHCNNN